MTKTEQIAILKTMTDEKDEAVLSAYLAIAGDKILRRRYPYGCGKTLVPVQYEYRQVEIAAYLVNKRGAEGETSHSENGIGRSYENGDVPESLMRDILPVAVSLGGDDKCGQ